MLLIRHYSHQMIVTGSGGLGNNRSSRDHAKNSIIKIGQNIEKNRGNLRLLLSLKFQ